MDTCLLLKALLCYFQPSIANQFFDGDDEGMTQPALVLDLTLDIRLVALDLLVSAMIDADGNSLRDKEGGTTIPL